jgi:putative transposase
MPKGQRRYKTWRRSHSVRLPGFDYREHVPYHVIIGALRGTKPFVDAQLAQMVCDMLYRTCDVCGAYLGAFCLMPDHLHLLISPDRSGMSLGNLVGRIKGATTNKSWQLGSTGTLWQNRFYDHVVRRSEGIAHVARYIYDNPDGEGLPNDYPYRFVDPALT